MASQDMESVAGNSNCVNEDLGGTPRNTNDLMLLKALQDFVVPLVCAADQAGQNNTNQATLGPAAEKLIISLREFISSIVILSQSKIQTGTLVKVDLDVEGNNDKEEDLSSTGEDRESSGEVTAALPEPSTSESNEDAVHDNANNNHDPLAQEGPGFRDKLLSALREHIFNMMPIRLLCFEPHGSSLEITLLERGAIYGRIASVLKANTKETELHPYESEQTAIDRLTSKYTRYAILSHTWLRESDEVTYSTWNKGVFHVNDPGYQKLVNFCKIAFQDHRLTFGWMDTVCINKESSSELDESIRSMYAWYRRASVCITYLAETERILHMHVDSWFTRGWTLQELLAPDVIKFYNSSWKPLVEAAENDKDNSAITGQIKRATTISKEELDNIYDVPISRRMQLAAPRKVTREEDTAYSLMGIFNVSISTAYGEGAQRAFFRLLQEILVSSTYYVVDLFNWAGQLPLSRPHVSRLLPSSPVYYLYRSARENLLLGRSIEPLTLTHLGLRVPVVLMPAISIPGEQSEYRIYSVLPLLYTGD